jgi:hypothetical protein
MRLISGISLALVLGLGAATIPNSTFAQTTTAAAPKPVTDATKQAIASFKADPNAWLAAAKAAGTLAVTVKDMIVADPTLSQAMIDFAKQADALSKANMAVGLAQAAGDMVQAGDATDAQNIQQQIALAGDTALLNSFVAGSNTVQTASTGATGATGTGGAAGGGGGTGGITNNGTGSPSNSTTGSSSGSTSNGATNGANGTTPTSTQNTTPTFTLASTTPTSTTTTTTSVSPSK